MNDTNAIPVAALQSLAQGAGYNFNSEEIAGITALGGAAVHVLHQAANAWGSAGGFDGLKQWLAHGNKSISATAQPPIVPGAKPIATNAPDVPSVAATVLPGGAEKT